MSEIMRRARHLFATNWLVMGMTWFFGILVTFFALAMARKVLPPVEFGMVLSGRRNMLWMVLAGYMLVGLATQGVTYVAMIRGVVQDGGDARGHGWRSLPRVASLGIVFAVPIAVGSAMGPLGLPLSLLGAWGFLLCLTDISVKDDPTWGVSATREIVVDHFGEVVPALLVGSVVLGGIYLVALTQSPFIGVAMSLPVTMAALCLAVAVHQHVFGSPEERYELEDLQRGDTYMTKGERSLPSYLQPVDATVAAAGGGVVAASFGEGAAAGAAAPAAATATPAAPAGMPGGTFSGALLAGTPWGEWIGIAESGLVELRLVWADGQAPFALNVATREGAWLPAVALEASPAVITLQLEAGWYYLHLQHAVDLPTPRGFHLAWRQVGVQRALAPAA